MEHLVVEDDPADQGESLPWHVAHCNLNDMKLCPLYSAGPAVNS
jgi:hypothetical protein